MTEMERAGDAGIDGKVMPDDDALTRNLDYLRLTYALNYPAKPNPYDRPEVYPQGWRIKAIIDDDEESNFGDAPRDDDGGFLVGEALVYVVPDIDRIDLFDTLDAHSGETAPFAEALHLTGGQPPRSLGATLDDIPLEGDLVILSSLFVEPLFRGHRAGHEILRGILRTIGRNAAVVMLRAAPVLSGEVEEEGSPAHQAASEALARYWAAAGFRPLWRDYMVLDWEGMAGLFGVVDDEDVEGDQERIWAGLTSPLIGELGAEGSGKN
jgi:hypothetical protein